MSSETRLSELREERASTKPRAVQVAQSGAADLVVLLGGSVPRPGERAEDFASSMRWCAKVASDLEKLITQMPERLPPSNSWLVSEIEAEWMKEQIQTSLRSLRAEVAVFSLLADDEQDLEKLQGSLRTMILAASSQALEDGASVVES